MIAIIEEAEWMRDLSPLTENYRPGSTDTIIEAAFAYESEASETELVFGNSPKPYFLENFN